MTVTFPDAPVLPDWTSPDGERQMDDWLAFFRLLTPKLQQFSGEVGPLAAFTDTLIAAIGFEGSWSTLAGFKAKGISVEHNSRLYRLMVDQANVAAVAPGTNGAIWFPINTEAWEQVGATVNLATGAPASVEVISGLTGYRDFKIVLDGVSHDAGSTQALQIATSGDGATFATAASISIAVAATTTLGGPVLIHDRNQRQPLLVPGIYAATGGDQLTAQTIDNLLVNAPTAAGLAGFRLSWSGGAGVKFDAGTMKVFGRGNA